ncbi:hypothetical protein SAMN04487944_11857 [Gracilibacillus ureilyticus]|uniref:Uncharacterized protein n=1 Tax=Gracilibacillus ureilyticus TaxID=531814 RepID=A0A1H9UNF1_9BACI|nr:DUF5693 family protein [Gracilibacillus ureilyticus]SES10543.1 hypothetical protein SAMN04487944_11857 [Gracilibacillus ureilyticus]
MLKLKKWVWIATIILILAAIPGIMERWNKETNSNTYNMIIPFHEIYELTKDENLDLDEVLTELREAGLTTISFEPDSLSKWEEQDIISKYEVKELRDIVRFHEDSDALVDDETGFYVTAPEEEYYDEKIKSFFQPVEITVGSERLYFIDEKNETEDSPPDDEPAVEEEELVTESNNPEMEAKAETEGTLKDDSQFESYFGYDESKIDMVKESGFEYVLRLENQESSNAQTIQDLLQLKDDQISSLLFSGEEVIGHPDSNKMKNYASQLNEAGYDFYSIEFVNQLGLPTFAYTSNFDFIRLHSLTVESDSIAKSVQTAVRAVKERNIRSVFIHVPTEVEPVESLEATVTFLERVPQHMPDQFSLGTPEPFEEINVPLWSTIAVLLAGIGFTYLALEFIQLMWIRIAGVIVTGLLTVGYLVTNMTLMLQAYGLGIALLTAIFATIHFRKAQGSLKDVSLIYLKSIGISFAGIAIMIGILNGSEFITGFAQFRGVILVYVIPMVVVTLWALVKPVTDMYHRLRGSTAERSTKLAAKLANAEVKYWHLILLAIAGGVIYYYITRTGNEGVATDFEIVFRQKLEELLYVRPRTKEFLIGFPLFILGVYVMGQHEKWGRFLLIPGSIGFLSIVNTFSHLHIPVYISLWRTAYSLVFGFLLGLVLILIYRWIYLSVAKLVKAG